MTVPSKPPGPASLDVVYKLGGSLLEWADLPARLDRVLTRESPHTRTAIVVGGGAAADAVRRWDMAHRLEATSAHGLAIAAMDFNARLVRELLRRLECDVVTRPHELRTGGILIPEMDAELDRAGSDVPHPSWDITSDSLAAWLAQRLGAKRVVLLKSTDPPGDCRLSTATVRQVIDPCFTQLSAGLEVEWINLRGGAVPTAVRLVP